MLPLIATAAAALFFLGRKVVRRRGRARRNPHLLRRGKKPLQIRNLGWLLSHSDNVERFTVTPYRGKSYVDGILTARMRDGSRYRTTYASKSILWTFLQRPKFIGLPIRWFGKDLVIAKGATQPNPARRSKRKSPRKARRTSKGWVRTTTVTRVTKLVRKNPGFLGGGTKFIRHRDGWVTDPDQPYGIPIGFVFQLARMRKDRRRALVAIAKKHLTAGGYKALRVGIASYMLNRHPSKAGQNNRLVRNPGSRFTAKDLEARLNEYNRENGLTAATGRFVLDASYGAVSVRWETGNVLFADSHEVVGYTTPKAALREWISKRARTVAYRAKKSNPRRKSRRH